MKYLSFLSILLIVSLNFSCIRENTAASKIEEAKKITLAWARLDDYPPQAVFAPPSSEGNSFTREFSIEFSGPRKEIEKWLQASPGIMDAERTVLADRSIRYRIKPGGGAQFAELILSAQKTRVFIHVYWS